MNRRLLLGRLATGLASAVVAPMAFVGGTRKFVVPEKAGSLVSVDHSTGSSGIIFTPEAVNGSIIKTLDKPFVIETATEAVPLGTTYEDQGGAINATPYGTIKKDEVIYTFLRQPCVLKFWELRCTNSNAEMVETVLRGIQEATKRGITLDTPQTGSRAYVGARYIDPWPNADLLLKHAEAVRANEDAFLMRGETDLVCEKLNRMYGCST